MDSGYVAHPVEKKYINVNVEEKILSTVLKIIGTRATWAELQSDCLRVCLGRAPQYDTVYLIQ